ncbi:hypothetical protein GCM10023350_46940 [Nocardioides endophyticus]|uniref:Uncharacterized protein n=1 Tax=Nocardioides endophyticus TaxID=1353775 RepID=A0ABP8ZGS2_9ACTN
MYANTVYRDYVKSEVEYRLGRVRGELAGRRWRRSIIRRGSSGESTFGTIR